MKNLLYYFILINIIFFPFDRLFSQSEKIKWIEPEEIIKFQQSNPKKIMIDLYTDWCGWCKVMDRTTFSDKNVAEKINSNFYPIKINAEYKGEINFNNKIYKYLDAKPRGINELAYYLTNGQLSYPMTIFLDEEFRIITLLPGYHKSNFFKSVLDYIGEDYWKDRSWEEFNK
tara:strand:- start:86 stop:601 length:516 start_codon:yes stop_codon:yes gene_type:complete